MQGGDGGMEKEKRGTKGIFIFYDFMILGVFFCWDVGCGGRGKRGKERQEGDFENFDGEK